MPVLAEINYEVEIPEGVTVKVDHGNHTIVKGPKGELDRGFRFRGVTISVEGDHVLVHKDLPRREHKAICGTYVSHIRNMIHGVTEGWTYTLKAVYNHFPIKVAVQGDKVQIENFLGERHPRFATIHGDGTKVDIKGQDITVTGIDRELVAQTAANMELATRIKGRDIRVFQDGIYITDKGGHA